MGIVDVELHGMSITVMNLYILYDKGVLFYRCWIAMANQICRTELRRDRWILSELG